MSIVVGSGLERRHLTQSGDRDDDRPRVFVDNGFLSGDLTGMTFGATIGDTHAARLLAKWINGLGCIAGPCLVAWMVHHAALVICTCMVGADGLTPFRR